MGRTRVSRSLLVLAAGWVVFSLSYALFPLMGRLPDWLWIVCTAGPLGWASARRLYPGASRREPAVGAAAVVVWLVFLQLTNWHPALAFGWTSSQFVHVLGPVTLGVVGAAAGMVAFDVVRTKERRVVFGATVFGVCWLGALLVVPWVVGYGGYRGRVNLWGSTVSALAHALLVVYPLLALAAAAAHCGSRGGTPAVAKPHHPLSGAEGRKPCA